MKKKLLTILPAICLLTGCGKETAGMSMTDSSSSAVSAETSQNGTTASSGEEETSSQTTTMKVSTDVPDDAYINTLAEAEVYDKLTVADIVTDTNGTLINGDDEVDTSKTGETEISVIFEYDGKNYEKKVTMSVQDTTPPLILNNGWSPYVQQNTEFDLETLVGYADNYDRKPKLTYTGSVDTSAIGTYPITATVTDSSGNSESWNMSVVVVSEIPYPEDNEPRTSFEDYISRYGNENTTLGIDVSVWQGDIDFDAVKAAGCEFVIIRMGYYYDEITMDECFLNNIEKAQAAGLKTGVYFYTTDNSVEGIKEHAKWIAENLDGRKLDFPVAFDWEEFTNFQEFGMNIKDLNDLFELFCDEMESYGYSGMLYSSKNFLNNFWTNEGEHMVWLAHFIDETDYTGDYSMWQASCTGNIPGIYGDVDVDILYKNK